MRDLRFARYTLGNVPLMSELIKGVQESGSDHGLVARAENSGSEGCYIEVARWQRVDAAKSRAEEIKKKLRDYVGRNQPLKQTVVDGSLVRVEMKNIGDHDNTRVDVTVEELIY